MKTPDRFSSRVFLSVPSHILIWMNDQRTVLVLADVDVFRLVARHAQLALEPVTVLVDEFKNILIHLPVKDNRIARVLLAVMDDGQLPVRLEHGALHVLDVVGARHAQLQRDVMREETMPHALINLELPSLDKPGGSAVDEALDRGTVGFQIFQDQHEQRPRNENEQKVQNRDSVVVDDAADNAAEYIVLHLIGRRVRRKVALAEQVDLQDQTEKAERQLCEHQRIDEHVSPPCPQSSHRGTADASARIEMM